ncbi:MAG: hypothetical protein QM756_01100 [Polyangiaceae bacterium]
MNDDPCTDWSTPLAANAISALGFSAVELAANVSGPRSSSLTWRALGTELSVGPWSKALRV